MLQGLRFADALKRSALRFLDERIDTLEKFAVRPLPIQIILPGMFGKNELHSTVAQRIRLGHGG